jgi:protein gp37
MSISSGIEWTDATWNAITGCQRFSPGCANCYAKRMAARLAGRCGYGKRFPFDPTFHADKLNLPRKWKKPRRVFVNSMGDLFHHDVKQDWLEALWEVMISTPRHTYLILTKRPDEAIQRLIGLAHGAGRLSSILPPHIWLGVSVENQYFAEQRIPLLLEIPAKVRFVSCEPLLDAIDLTRLGSQRAYFNALSGEVWGPGSCGQRIMVGTGEKIQWVIAGGETGPGARLCDCRWIAHLYEQALDNNVPFFFKQWGGRNKGAFFPQIFCDIEKTRCHPTGVEL